MAQNEESPIVVNSPDEKQTNVRLQRHLGTKNIIVLAFIGCLGLVELLPLGIGYGLWPSANVKHYLALAIGFNLVVVLLYSLIGEVVAHSGSEYLFSSRVLHPPLAFAASFCSQLASVVMVGGLAVLVSQAVLTPFFYYLSWTFHSSDLAAFAAQLSQPQGAAITGATVVVLAFFTSLLPPKEKSRFLVACIILALVGWAAIFLQLLTADPAHFAANWDLIIDEGSFDAQVPAARAFDLALGESPSLLVLAGIPLGFLLLGGARLPSLTAGEIKGSIGKKQWLGGWLAVLVCGGLALGSILLVNRSVPNEWLAAESYLFIFSSQLKTPAMPWLPFYATLLRPNLILFFLSTLGALAALIAALQAFLATLGHVFVAWSDDAMLTDLAGYIHVESQTPLVANLLVAILAQIGVSIAANYGVTKILAVSLDSLICLQIFPALAAVLFPLARQKWERSGGTHASIWMTLSLVICGLLVLIYMGLMIAGMVIYPSQGYVINIVDIILLVASYLLGIVWFSWRARLARGRGVRMAAQFSDMPEE